ncbi:MAG: amidohydrolase family protein, partial [Bacteroidota bacterium]|nr:amidohydrolase family protein [Bacteroidota bacterium]
MKNILLILFATVTAAGAFMSVVSAKKNADIIIINAKIYCVDAKNSTAEALAVHGSKIIAVGSSQDIQNRYASQNIIDAKGKTVVPGMIDAHGHLLGLGASLTELNFAGTTSAQQITDMIAQRVKELKPGEWIRGRGWDQNDWGIGTGKKPFPTASPLDIVAPNNPVVLSRVDGHALWVNSKAMEL